MGPLFLQSDLSDAYYQMEMDKGKKNLYNQHIARIVQDMQASAELEEFFIKPPELHRANSQGN